MKWKLIVKCGQLVPQHMKRFIQLSLLATAVSIFAGCSAPRAVPSEGSINSPNGNFHLYVLNRSFAISPVDIKIFIDGDLVVKGDFDVDGQHSYQPFVLNLSPGRHKIVAESSKGHAKFERVFDVEDKSWAALAYLFDSKPEGGAQPTSGLFVFVVKGKPIYFM
jgi:hypothetical protein